MPLDVCQILECNYLQKQSFAQACPSKLLLLSRDGDSPSSEEMLDLTPLSSKCYPNQSFFSL